MRVNEVQPQKPAVSGLCRVSQRAGPDAVLHYVGEGDRAAVRRQNRSQLLHGPAADQSQGTLAQVLDGHNAVDVGQRLIYTM